MTDLDPQLTDENAQKVLARALELQARNADGLTVTQIREIASELSIPQSAVDQALSEYRTAGVAEPSPRTDDADAHTSRRRDRPARLLVISLAFLGGAVVLLTVLTIIMRLSPSS